MDSTKLDISGKTDKKSPDSPLGTYKPIPESEMEEKAPTRPKSLVKVHSGEVDGADEKMLPKEEHTVVVNLSDMKSSPSGKQNGETKLEISENKPVYSGMDKEELMKYANDPFWVRLRWFLFILFWLLWAGMLVGAIMIIVAAPKCDPPAEKTWWEKGPLTKIIAVDTSCDAPTEVLRNLSKDIKGLIVPVKADAYKPINDSSCIVKLIRQAKDKEVKVIIEFNPTWSELWFKDSNFSQFYVWNNRSITGWLQEDDKSAWKETNSPAGQYYYAPLDKPHLNFYNERVQEEFLKVVKNYLNLGASGVSLRNASLIYYDREFREQKFAGSLDSGATFPNTSKFYSTSMTQNRKGLAELLLSWKNIIKNITEDGVFMLANTIPTVDKAYKINNSLVVDLPIERLNVPTGNVNSTVNRLNQTLEIDGRKWPLWKIIRNASFPDEVLDVFAFLLPGVPLIEYNYTINSLFLTKARESPSVMHGNVKFYGINNTVMAYTRVKAGSPGWLVILNCQDQKVTINAKKEINEVSEVDQVTVSHYSNNYLEKEFQDINGKKDHSFIPLSPKSILVLSYVPKKKD